MGNGHDELQMSKSDVLQIVNRIETRCLTGTSPSQARQVMETEGLHEIDTLS